MAAIVYLAVLGWDMAKLETNFSLLFGHDQRQGEYNPMEPGHPIAERRAVAGTSELVNARSSARDQIHIRAAVNAPTAASSPTAAE